MATAEFKITNFTVDDSATIKAKLDANAAVVARLGAGFQCYAANPVNMTVKVAAGGVQVGGALIELGIQVSGAIVAPVANPRIDRVVTDQNTGVASVVTGVENVAPVAPPIPAGQLACARIALAVGQATITNNNITDERPSDVIGQPAPGADTLSNFLHL